MSAVKQELTFCTAMVLSLLFMKYALKYWEFLTIPKACATMQSCAGLEKGMTMKKLPLLQVIPL